MRLHNIASSSPKLRSCLNPLVGADAYLVRLDEMNADNSIKAKAIHVSNPAAPPLGSGRLQGPSPSTMRTATPAWPSLEKGIRLGILISRLGDNSDSAVAAIHGTEVSSSPRETYDDASVDFALENDVVYQHIDPAVGASTHSATGRTFAATSRSSTRLIIDHGNIAGAPPELTPEMAVDATDETFGTVSGERLSQADSRWRCGQC